MRTSADVSVYLQPALHADNAQLMRLKLQWSEDFYLMRSITPSEELASADMNSTIKMIVLFFGLFNLLQHGLLLMLSFSPELL